ncbi:TetR family transcriptional regulator [Corynebacterium sp. KPL2813]
MALNVVKRFAEEQGAVVAADGDISPLEIGRITLALWSLIHGMGHLSVVGILRLQHAVIRAANLKQVDRLVVDALQYWFKNKQIPQRRPIMNDARGIVEKVMGSEREKPFVAPDNLEQMDPEEAKKVIIEAALRVAGRNGVDRRFFDHVAEKLGTSKDFLTTIMDNDFALREVAETLTTTEMAKIFEACLAELPDDTPTVDRLQIVAAAYFNYAMMYPERFSSIIALASGSVVPHNGDGSSHEGMTKNFAIMMDLLRKFVIEMGITPTDQLVYISTLAVWAGANGIAHLCSIGDFKSFNEDLKWALFIQVVTVSFFAIAHGLQILGHENEEFKQV